MGASRPSFLLVDGNNIIHAWPDLLAMHRRRKGSAHSELISRLESYRDFTGDRVVIVFDGKGAITQEERREDGLQIFYTGESHTADDIIERLAIRYADTYDIIVATDDRAEQDIVVGAGLRCDGTHLYSHRTQIDEKGGKAFS
jgi:predicted RNA-binding protein with PIN domain